MLLFTGLLTKHPSSIIHLLLVWTVQVTSPVHRSHIPHLQIFHEPRRSMDTVRQLKLSIIHQAMDHHLQGTTLSNPTTILRTCPLTPQATTIDQQIDPRMSLGDEIITINTVSVVRVRPGIIVSVMAAVGVETHRRAAAVPNVGFQINLLSLPVLQLSARHCSQRKTRP